MKLLIIWDKNEVIEKVPLIKDRFFIGRSPICDVYINRSDMRDVQFAVRSENPEDMSEAGWVIYSATDAEGSNYHYNLNSNPQQVENFLFSIEEDRRDEKEEDRRQRVSFSDRRNKDEYKRGGLARNLRQFDASEQQADRVNGFLLEVIFINTVLNSVTNVAHLRGKNRKWRCFSKAPEVYASLNRHNQIVLSGYSKKTPFKVTIDNISITEDILKQPEFTFKFTDQVHVIIDSVESILRVVPIQKYTIESVSPLRDRLFQMTLGTLGIMLLIFVLMRYVPEFKAPVAHPKVRFLEVEKDLELPKPREVVLTPIIPEIPAELTTKSDEPEIIHPNRRVASVNKKEGKPTVIKKKKSDDLLSFLSSKSTNTGASINPNLVDSASNAKDPTAPNYVSRSGPSSGLAVKSGRSSDVNLASVGKEMTGVRVGSADLGRAPNSVSGSNSKDFKELGLGSGSTGTGQSGRAGSGGLDVSGAITRDSILQTLKANSAAFTGCHDSALLRAPTIEGTMEFEWIIGSSGQVASVRLKTSTINDGAFKVCVEDVLRGIRFESNTKGLSTRVSNPFRFIPRTD